MHHPSIAWFTFYFSESEIWRTLQFVSLRSVIGLRLTFLHLAGFSWLNQWWILGVNIWRTHPQKNKRAQLFKMKRKGTVLSYESPWVTWVSPKQSQRDLANYSVKQGERVPCVSQTTFAWEVAKWTARGNNGNNGYLVIFWKCFSPLWTWTTLFYRNYLTFHTHLRYSAHDFLKLCRYFRKIVSNFKNERKYLKAVMYYIMIY